MTEKVHENNGVSASPNSYVVIRIKLPTIKTLVGRVTSKRSNFGKRVGSVFNNVLGKKNSMDETEPESENVVNTASGEGVKKTTVDTYGMGEKVKPIAKERPFKSPRRTAESEEISRRIDMQLKKMKVQDVVSDDDGSKGVEFETETSCGTFTDDGKKKILMGTRCRPLSDENNRLIH